jgi:hypothetical protein
MGSFNRWCRIYATAVELCVCVGAVNGDDRFVRSCGQADAAWELYPYLGCRQISSGLAVDGVVISHEVRRAAQRGQGQLLQLGALRS